MEKFVVSARKYRPKQFSDVVGQASVTDTLRNALKSGHVAQSFLFCGPRGVGKTTCARILAKAINCLQPNQNFEPCGGCASCISFDQNASFNIYELDAASNNSVNDIRDLVDQVRTPPQGAKYKVYIIDEVHMLSSSAFNAFLKTLEEPPSYAIFILATTEKHKIIPTILSRCQIYDFSRITINDIVLHLESISKNESVQSEKSALILIARKADGALRDALSMFDRLTDYVNKTLTLQSVLTNLNILDYEYYFQLTEGFLTYNTTAVLLLIDEILDKGFDGDLLLNGVVEHLRNLLVCKDLKTAQLIDADGELKSRYLMQAEIISADFLLNAMNILSQYEMQYKSAKNKRILIEICLLKLTQLNHFFQPTAPVAEKKKPDPLTSSTNKVEGNKPSLQIDVKPEKVASLNVKEVEKSEESPIDEVPIISHSLVKKKIKSLTGTPISEIILSEKTNPPDSIKSILNIQQEQLSQLWFQFADNLQDSHPYIAAMKEINIPYIEDHFIVFDADSIVVQNQLEGIKTHWIEFLQQHEIYTHQIRVVIDTTKRQSGVVPKRNFSDKEKIEAMMTENTHLLEFIHRLNLKFA